MFPYTNRARVQDSKQQNFELARGCTYDLQSVVVHVGNLESGQFNFQVDIESILTTQATMFLTPESETSGSNLMTIQSLLHRSRKSLMNRHFSYFTSFNHWHDTSSANSVCIFHTIHLYIQRLNAPSASV